MKMSEEKVERLPETISFNDGVWEVEIHNDGGRRFLVLRGKRVRYLATESKNYSGLFMVENANGRMVGKLLQHGSTFLQA